MKCKVLIIFFLTMIVLLPSALHAHGVKGKLEPGGIVVSAEYDTGELMSYAKVTISAPGTEVIFQSGRTDRNGRFCFFPDAAGDWKVVVDDAIGHRLEIIVPVNNSMGLKSNQQKGESAASSLFRYERALIGVCIIFAISGVFFWWKGKRMYRKNK